MTPGCLTISEDASVAEAAEAMAVTASTRSSCSGRRTAPRSAGSRPAGCSAGSAGTAGCASARDAITEQVTAIAPHESVRVALYALSTAGTTRLLVRRRPHQLPEGVLTDFDLAVAAGR